MADATIPPTIRARVAEQLAALEAEHGVRVLYCAESGSRAWGFGSPDSDYDVRFIYAHPADWYLRLIEPRDVIEKGIDADLIDLNGWDVRKALRLLLKSNPAFFEWLVSPIVYRDDGVFADAARPLFLAHAAPMTLAGHYQSIARGQWQREIADTATPRLKKYFYCIRPLLALQWVADRQTPPPMAIDDLRAATHVPPAVNREIDQLLLAKRSTPELGTGPRIGVLDAWIEASLAAGLPNLGERIDRTQTMNAADRLLIETIRAR